MPARTARRWATSAGRARIWVWTSPSRPHSTATTTLEESAKILAIVNEGEVSGAAAKGEKITVVLDRTPFYAEMGGQIGDHGVIAGKNGAMTVSDVQKTKDGKYMHIGVVTEGELSVEDEVYGFC